MIIDELIGADNGAANVLLLLCRWNTGIQVSVESNPNRDKVRVHHKHFGFGHNLCSAILRLVHVRSAEYVGAFVLVYFNELNHSAFIWPASFAKTELFLAVTFEIDAQINAAIVKHGKVEINVEQFFRYDASFGVNL